MLGHAAIWASPKPRLVLRLLLHGRHGLFQRGGPSGQEFDGFAYVPVDRRDPDTEACCETGVGVAPAQVCQDEQGLPATGQATPPGADLTAVACEETGEVVQVRLDRSMPDE